MRPDLEELLRSQFPVLYGRSPWLGDTGPAPFSPELGDGWFAILHALSRVLERHADQAGLDRFQILRIAPLPRGGLHCHTSWEDQFVQGAVDAARHMSLAVSAVSGMPGRPMVSSDGRRLILAPGEANGCQPVPARALRPYRAPVGAGRPGSLKWLGRRWDRLVALDIDIPAGWADVANVVLTAFAATPDLIDWIRAWHGGAVGQLIVGWDAQRSSPHQDGAVAFAVSMAALVDPATGACGPVDDTGAPHWWRRVAGWHAALPFPWGGYDGEGVWRSREDSVSGPAVGHPSAGSLIAAIHREAGDMQVSIRPSVAQVVREMARHRGADGCAALLAELLGLSFVEPSPIPAEEDDGDANAATDGSEATSMGALAAIRFHLSAAHARLTTAVAAAHGTAHEEAIRAACSAIGAILDKVNHEAEFTNQTSSGCQDGSAAGTRPKC